MFIKKERPKYQLMLEDEVERTIRHLKTHTTDSEEYAKTLSYVERLHEMIGHPKPTIVSKDALLNAGANLLGILMIIRHENVNVITSKALSFVTRVK